MEFHLESLTKVAVVAIVFVVPFAFVALVFLLSHKQKLAREQTIRVALEKGDKLSPELLAVVQSTFQKQDRDRGGLPSAVFLACIMAGVGCTAEFQEHGVIGLFLFLGLGFVLRAILSDRQRAARAKEDKKI